MFFEEIKNKTRSFLHIILSIKDSLQGQIHYNGNIFGNTCCRCKEGSLYITKTLQRAQWRSEDRTQENHKQDRDHRHWQSGTEHLKQIKEGAVVLSEDRSPSLREHAYIILTPIQPHFYIVKLGFTGVYIIFLISAQKHGLWVLVICFEQKYEKYLSFSSENF